MATFTDPARELTDLCMALSDQSNERGDAYLAQRFEVSVWSTQFFQIIFAVRAKADDLKSVLAQVELDADHTSEAVEHINQIQRAFSPEALQSPWNHAVNKFLNPQHVNPVKFLSSSVRRVVCYPKLNDAEIKQLKEQLDELAAWLMEHQLQEQDFIRQALLEGIGQLRFRVERIGWLGWGYTVNSLRDVIGAYLMLHHLKPDPGIAPVASAILKKTAATMVALMGILQIAKETVDTADFVLKAYRAATLTIEGHQGLSGLPTSATC